MFQIKIQSNYYKNVVNKSWHLKFDIIDWAYVTNIDVVNEWLFFYTIYNSRPSVKVYYLY